VNMAATGGYTQCLHVLQDCGFQLSSSTWARAAEGGYIDCLEFAVAHGYALEDCVLEIAVHYGRLDCVDFLIQHGLPHAPYMHFIQRVEPAQQQCIQLMIDRKVAIHPVSLIVAAGCGDLDFVRWLHRHGVPLWQHACDTHRYRIDDLWHDRLWWSNVFCHSLAEPRTLPIPWRPKEVVPIWKALRYGAVFGAPVTPHVKELFEEKRRRSRAVLGCFKAAARLSAVPGPARQKRIWAGMAALPSSIVEEILILAGLEIPESVMRRRPAYAPSLPSQ
jgi:hypothetical protein